MPTKKKGVSRKRTTSQPEGRKRKAPGTTGKGNWFHIEVRPKGLFVMFRNHDVGKKSGDLERVAGKRASGSWATQAWLVSKQSAHKEGKHLVADTKDVKKLFKELRSEPIHVKGDIFEAKDRVNVPEKAKPTKAQKVARAKNIKKAQNTRASKKKAVRSKGK